MLAVAAGNPLAQYKYIEPDQLADQVLITYPVERQRLDVFTVFLDPAGVEPAALRKAELTPIIAQLVASQRGVAALPNWALTEYLDQGRSEEHTSELQALMRISYAVFCF